tara:strand:+ start:330 stop:482 length:153 start_codon:yes stop_codon:yes gene_type:complete
MINVLHNFIHFAKFMSDQYFIKKEKITALASTAIFKFVENAKIAKSVDSV